jgi:hypothetical protein
MLPSSSQKTTTSFYDIQDTSFFLNLRFIGVGFRGYIVKKKVQTCSITQEQKNFAISYLRDTQDSNTSRNEVSEFFIEILMLKVGKSAITAYPIPAEVKIFCPTDQQQQTNNEPLLLVSKNYTLLTSVAAEIKSYKVPDVYKGSGIFLCERLETSEVDDYINETILRKEIKKK